MKKLQQALGASILATAGLGVNAQTHQSTQALTIDTKATVSNTLETGSENQWVRSGSGGLVYNQFGGGVEGSFVKKLNPDLAIGGKVTKQAGASYKTAGAIGVIGDYTLTGIYSVGKQDAGMAYNQSQSNGIYLNGDKFTLKVESTNGLTEGWYAKLSQETTKDKHLGQTVEQFTTTSTEDVAGVPTQVERDYTRTTRYGYVGGKARNFQIGRDFGSEDDTISGKVGAGYGEKTVLGKTTRSANWVIEAIKNIGDKFRVKGMAGSENGSKHGSVSAEYQFKDGYVSVGVDAHSGNKPTGFVRYVQAIGGKMKKALASTYLASQLRSEFDNPTNISQPANNGIAVQEENVVPAVTVMTAARFSSLVVEPPAPVEIPQSDIMFDNLGFSPIIFNRFDVNTNLSLVTSSTIEIMNGEGNPRTLTLSLVNNQLSVQVSDGGLIANSVAEVPVEMIGQDTKIYRTTVRIRGIRDDEI